MKVEPLGVDMAVELLRGRLEDLTVAKKLVEGLHITMAEARAAVDVAHEQLLEKDAPPPMP